MTSRNSNTNIASGIIANGNNSINTTTLIAQNTFYNQVATCTAGDNSIKLPIQGFLSQEYNIRNDGASTLNVFPSSSSGQINALGNGVSFQLTTGQSCTFVASTSDPLTSNTLQWYSFNLTASGTGGAFTTLTVSGAATTTGITNTGDIASGTIQTSGAATLNSLGVTGAATIGTTLGITGTTTAAAINAVNITDTGITTVASLVYPTASSFTQSTSGTTTVVGNASKFSITLYSGTNSLPASSTITFTVTNSFVNSNSVVLITPLTNLLTKVIIGTNSYGAGTFKILLFNPDTVSAADIHSGVLRCVVIG